MGKHRLALSTVAWVVLACGCGGSGLKLRLIDASHQRPSNVAVYFTVDTFTGEPVGGLTAESFRIYEDGELVSATEDRRGTRVQALLPIPEVSS